MKSQTVHRVDKHTPDTHNGIVTVPRSLARLSIDSHKTFCQITQCLVCRVRKAAYTVATTVLPAGGLNCENYVDRATYGT